MLQVEKTVNGVRRSVRVTAVDPHLTTWYGPEVSLSLSVRPHIAHVSLEPPQCHQREGGSAGAGVLRELLSNSQDRPGHHRRRPELHPRQRRVLRVPVPH